MNTWFLKKHPEFFQGTYALQHQKDYFEGWYFKHSNFKNSIAFIPGIHVHQGMSNAFIQIITDYVSYYVQYPITDFQFFTNPFSIKIKNNTFSMDGLHIDISDRKQNLKIYGDLKYTYHKKIHTHFLSPNIMGPFSYMPFMECHHAILSMQNRVQGLLHINKDEFRFSNGMGYIEKDWGCSFPKSYIWCQGNYFQNTNASFMLSIADIPFSFFHFRGLIGVLLIEQQEFRFTTYNFAKIIKYNLQQQNIAITLKKGNTILDICIPYILGRKLVAPAHGKMDRPIFESLSASISLTLTHKKQIVFQDTSIHGGLEIVGEST